MKRNLLVSSLLITLSLAAIAAAQQQPNPLRPPAGAKVAIVVFEDLQCPDCANAAPLLEEARKTYKIPLVRHDFPLTKHNWSKQAAILARYFDTKSKKVGDEFRDYCFRHQAYPNKETPYINNPDDLRQQAEQFAAAHKLALPLVIDPQGKLQAKVQADLNLGVAIGVEHTPTIYVVSDKAQGKPFVEIVDRSNLFSQIDQMIAEAGAAKPAAGKKRAAAKPSAGMGR